MKDSNRGKPGNTKHYSPPWNNDFDECFSTESKVPTYWKERATPIAFESKQQLALIDNHYKIYSKNNGETFELYDITRDRAETQNHASKIPKIVKEMKGALIYSQRSCRASAKGMDY
jgi:hypothetical protein